MKRAISIIFILAATAAAGKAQYFIEGSIDISYNEELISWSNTFVQNKKVNSAFFFSVSPSVGYQLNDKIAVGAKVSFSTSIVERISPDVTYNPDLDMVTISRQPRWSFGVFGRYQLWGTEKLSLLFESSVSIGRGSTTEEQTGSITKKTESQFSFGVNAAPLVTYDISERWSIKTTINLLSLSSNFETVKNEETGHKTKDNRLDFGAGSSFSPLSINLGFIYHFK